ncbi:MAG: hypothetical protein J0H43_11995, partial [Actinobacteria bacterium]|nr:hypothetical protein [Actinomycetota bacterium]
VDAGDIGTRVVHPYAEALFACIPTREKELADIRSIPGEPVGVSSWPPPDGEPTYPTESTPPTGHPPPTSYPPIYPYPPVGGYGWFPVPPSRPGTLTAAAVLGYVSAGLVSLAGIVLFTGASLVSDVDDSTGASHDSLTAEFVVDGFLNLIIGALLIAGGIWMCSRRSSGRVLYTVGGALVVAESVYWMVRWSNRLSDDVGLIVYALIFATIAIVGLSLAWVREANEWLRTDPVSPR